MIKSRMPSCGTIFGYHAPEFMVMSATFRLPFGMLPVHRDDLRQVDGLLRELHYHPEHCLEQVSADELAEFQRLVDKNDTGWRGSLQIRPGSGISGWNSSTNACAPC